MKLLQEPELKWYSAYIYLHFDSSANINCWLCDYLLYSPTQHFLTILKHGQTLS